MKKLKNNITFIFVALTFVTCAQNNKHQTVETDTKTKHTMTENSNTNQWNTLTDEETRVIVNKGTERANVGEFVNNHEDGTYLCKRCDAPLFKSGAKFESGSGWPAFDDMIDNAVQEIPDADGQRIEIVCNNCKGHLGHVFKGEGFTDKSTRHCVNSISMSFKSDYDFSTKINQNIDTAIFASGCFWGTEYFFEKAEGVISTQVGYIGGHVDNVTYKEICTGTTGHAEAVQVTYDNTVTDFKTMCKLFFETHNPEQENGQGVDIGTQYRSGVFYMSNEQKTITEELINILETKNGLKVATEVTEASIFWKGEDYHEHYYSTKNALPTCHGYHKLFDEK